MNTTKTATTLAERIDAMKTAVLGDDHAAMTVMADKAMALASALPPAPVNPERDPLTTGTLTAAWVDAEADRLAADARRTTKRNLLIGLARDARGRADAIRTTRTDAMLSGLGDLLGDLVTEVRDLGTQMGGHVDTISAAVAAGHGNQWQRLTALADDYAELRAEQERLTPTGTLIAARPANGQPDPVASDLFLADLDHLWPYWRTPHLDPNVSLSVLGDTRREPWPQDPAEQLLWIARHGQPWVPTAAQLADLNRQRQDRTNPTDHDTIRPHGDRYTERTTT